MDNFDFLYFLSVLEHHEYSAYIAKCDDRKMSIVISDGEHFTRKVFDTDEISLPGNTNLILFRDVLMTIDKLNVGIGDDFEFIMCDCGGIICDERHKQAGYFRCSKCGKVYAPQEIKYDKIEVNQQTGWVFPVKWRG